MDSHQKMPARSFSIAEARQNLAALVHQVEEQGACQLTRRGRAVAVLVSMEDYQRLERHDSPSLWDVVCDARSRMTEGLQDDDLDDLRHPEPGRDFHWPE